VRGEVSAQLQDLLGSAGAQAVNAMLVGASKPMEGALATVLGLGALLFAAVGLVVQLKDALNTVWEVEPRHLHQVQTDASVTNRLLISTPAQRVSHI
jgi:uncharacterized BrkB/YihY/UPF0761 family membrane protein